eukprot:246448-Chlamydomonas_euryale.AAC.2
MTSPGTASSMGTLIHSTSHPNLRLPASHIPAVLVPSLPSPLVVVCLQDGNARGKDGAALDLDTFTAWATCRASEVRVTWAGCVAS